MSNRRLFVHAIFVLLLPLIVAAFGLSVWSALVLVLLALLWRWAIVAMDIIRPRRAPELVLETISASHYVEKVRWCMDRLGLDYTEVAWAGTLGAFYKGRTVPRLIFRSGRVYSQIGNSAEILRYLWGACAATHGEAAEFLQPTAERLQLEQRIDRYGANLQVWIYYHILDDAGLCKHVWGVDNPATPWWQRKLVGLLFPLQAFFMRRVFDTSTRHYERCRQHIQDLLADVDTKLADGRASILGGRPINYTDLAFAAMSGVWLQPPGYGGGAADTARFDRVRAPEPMREDIERWIENYPRAASFVEKLYAAERKRGPSK